MMSFQPGHAFIRWAIVGVFFGAPMTSFGMDDAIQTPSPASGHEASIQSITPADVLARVQLVRKELEDIRFEMGKPKSRDVGLLVEEASPHEVYFQAKTLDQKVARLTSELTEQTESLGEHEAPGEIRPFHVWKVVDTSLRRILSLKQELGLTFTNSESLPDPDATPTQVFFVIGLANKQVNLLLLHQFSPKDVSEQVSLGIGYSMNLLRKYSPSTTSAPLPSLERGRLPWDNYSRLIECYTLLGEIARASQIKMLKLATQNLDRPDVQPNDVYDLATLIISELAYLHAHLPDALPPEQTTLHGPILPSHVYQQAGALLAQLQALKKEVQAHPTGLQ